MRSSLTASALGGAGAVLRRLVPSPAAPVRAAAAPGERPVRGVPGRHLAAPQGPSVSAAPLAPAESTPGRSPLAVRAERQRCLGDRGVFWCL